MSSNCPDVNCLRPECIDKCGPIQWFGNLSPCHVRFEYQAPGGSIWHSLGEYYPGTNTKLGAGSLWLPRESTVRAVDINTGHVVQNWGRVGAGLPSLFVDNTMCAIPAGKHLQNTESKKFSPLRWTVISIVSVTVILVIAVLVWLLVKKRRHI